MIKKIVIGSLCAACLSAQEGNIVPLGPVNSSEGTVYPSGKLRAVLMNKTMFKDSLYDGKEKVDNPTDKKATISNTNLNVRYGLGYGIDIRAVIPYVYKNSEQNNPSSGKKFEMDNQGVGDIAAIARYQLLNQKDGDIAFVMAGFGVFLPTGNTDKSFYNSNIPGNPRGYLKPGVRTPAQSMPNQLGSGSVDYIYEFGATRFFKNSRVDFYLRYIDKQKGAHEFEFGDQFSYDLSYAYALNGSFDIGLELNGLRVDNNTQEGVKCGGSGGTFYYVTPEVHYKINKTFDISLGVPVLVSADANYGPSKYGTATSSPLESYQIVTRLGVNF